MTPELKPVTDTPRLHQTPLASITYGGGILKLTVDDESEKRYEISFFTCQAMRLTTSDCFIPPQTLFFEGGIHQGNRVMEVVGSEWIAQLKDTLSNVDHHANFLEKSRHFIVPLADDFLEVVCWKLESNRIGI